MAKVLRTKRVAILPAKGKDGREIHEVEVAELGNFEVVVDIPARVHNIRDAAVRAERVKALVLKEAAPRIAQLEDAHA